MLRVAQVVQRRWSRHTCMATAAPRRWLPFRSNDSEGRTPTPRMQSPSRRARRSTALSVRRGRRTTLTSPLSGRRNSSLKSMTMCHGALPLLNTKLDLSSMVGSESSVLCAVGPGMFGLSQNSRLHFVFIQFFNGDVCSQQSLESFGSTWPCLFIAFDLHCLVGTRVCVPHLSRHHLDRLSCSAVRL